MLHPLWETRWHYLVELNIGVLCELASHPLIYASEIALGTVTGRHVIEDLEQPKLETIQIFII